MIVHRKQLRETIADLVAMLQHKPNPVQLELVATA